MTQTRRNPNSAEAIEAVLQAIRETKREELVEWIKWRPEGYEDPEGEEDPWKEFLKQEAMRMSGSTTPAEERSPSVAPAAVDESAA